MSVRSVLRDFVFGELLPRPLSKRPRSSESDQIVVAGMFGSGNGLGRAARGCLEALKLEGLNPIAIDTSSILNQLDKPALPDNRPIQLNQPGTLILYANPPELELCLSSLGFRRWHAWRIIGAWVWETPKAPTSWRRQTKFVSEIWAPSRFVAASFDAAFDVPVKVVPHFLESVATLGNLGAATDGLTDQGQNGLHILALADARSSLTRKNPLGAVSMFHRAFPNASDVKLTLKTQRLGQFPHYQDQLLRAIGEDQRIQLIDRTLSSDEQAALIHGADIILSPHRSEGFGLSLAEAMMLGKCVVATGWSGNLEFMDADNAALLPYTLIPIEDSTGVYFDDPSAVWAEPDLSEGAAILARLARDSEHRLKLGMRARESIRQTLTAKRYAEALLSASA